MAVECSDCGLRKEVGRLKEENKRLGEELQRLRLEVFGFRPSRKGRQNDACSHGASGAEGVKLGPPFGHEGVSRSKPENVDRRVVLKLRSCPHCDSRSIKPLKPRHRYKEDIGPGKALCHGV